MIKLPGPTSPLTYARVALSGATYALEWKWNERDSAWYFGMDDPSGEPLVRSVRVVLNVDLLNGVPQSDRRPPYGLWVFDPQARGVEPTFTSLAESLAILYAEPDEADE